MGKDVKDVFLILAALERIQSYCSERLCNNCALWRGMKYNKSDYECALRGNKKRPKDWEIEFNAEIRL